MRQTKEFKKGKRYGYLEKESSKNFLFGWGCLLGALFFVIADFFRNDNDLLISVVLLVVGMLNHLKAETEKKELKLMENQRGQQ